MGPHGWAKVRQHVERALAGEELSFDNQVRCNDGRTRDVHVTYVPHRDAEGAVRGFAALLVDVSDRRRAERSLLHSERMLAESQAAAHVGSWEATLNEGEGPPLRDLEWSDEAYRMFGYDPASTKMTHRMFVASVHPDDREGMQAMASAGLKRGGSYEKEYRIVRPDGTVRVIHSWTNVERGDGERPTRLLGTCQDITDLKLAEQKIREAREQLQLVVDSTPALFARCDLERRLIWTNKTNAARFGKTPEQLIGQPLREIIGDEAYAVIEKALDRVLGGETFEFEAELPYRVLGPRSLQMAVAPTLDARGQIDGSVAVITDITHRRELERALLRSEERYRSLAGAITSLVWRTDAVGDFVEPQPAWEAFTGQTWAQHQGSNWRLAIHPEDRHKIDDVAADAVATGSFKRLPCRIWHAASAEYRFSETSAVVIRNPDGSIREWIGTLIDVHEQERARQDLKDADRRKDEFLAMLSHELRNPLAPILSSVEILGLVDQRDPALAATYRNVIAQQVQHMKRLLDDLLDISRVSQGKIELRKERLDLQDILLQAVEISRPLLVEKQQRLSVKPAPAPVLIEADPTRLVQVFANLLDNAAKYSDRGGHVELDLSVEDGDALVRVRDDGAGMSPDLLENAFDLFVQETRSLDRAQGGLGIGLTMVRSLVKMHGGSVRAFSEGPGRGCELVVKLPRALG